MADNVTVTPGAGASVRSIDRSGVATQVTQVDVGGESGENLLVADPAYGIPVDVKRLAGSLAVTNSTPANLKVDASGVAVPITDNAGSLTVDAPAGTPVAVRLSTGSAFIDTVPVSQGTPASAGSGWPVKINDGTTTAGVDAGTQGLKVYVVSGAAGGTSMVDKATFTDGSTSITPAGGEYATAPSDPTDGHAAAVRITAKRAFHVNLRADAGTEIGSASAPIRTDPTDTTAQTVKLKDSTGTAYSATNPLYTVRGGRAYTRVTKSVSLAASQTGAAVWTPASGKKFYIQKMILIVSVTGTLKLFDSSDSAANRVFDGTLPVGVFPFDFDEPWASATADNILNYTSGSGLTAVVTLHGFEV